MPTTRKARPFRSQNADFRAEVAAHARAMAKPMRSTAKPGDASDEKAIEYARWLLARDGIELDAVIAATRTAHNAAFPPIEMKRGKQRWTEQNPFWVHYDDFAPRVENAYCAAGLRPRFVHFEFVSTERIFINGRAVSRLGKPLPVVSVELPNWAAAPDLVDDLAAA